ncbi:alpha/beta-hydrolase family protein [Microbulbifer bruguierae]|uniref:Alpha/beta-hydrolase family protein n=1 Tax=Microbulbifer bruguierae TaxID=3029061 RepID=A0ABY8NGR8_9GAMM|nr:alpha/beta-hydrolase family protein [Microbulbifer bruguierae]WGL17242.1 alpha/beta-hydrolase family protein [Microbulbifer bruguierae]
MRLTHFFSTAGLLVGTIFFALSLTPSLIPREGVVQGSISGLSFAAGYAVGVFLHWLWRYLELRTPGEGLRRVLRWVIGTFCVLLALAFLWQAAGWQNSVRALMGLEEAPGVRPLTIAVVAALVFLFLLLIAKLFRRLFYFFSNKLQRRVPRRIATFLGLAGAFILFWAVFNDVVLSAALHKVDGIYQRLDAKVMPDMAVPRDPLKAGSRESLLRWQDMGHQGRRYLALGPSAEDIAEVTGEAKEPIRVYVGLNAAETPAQRATLALEELKRVGGFDRPYLILITPTGTGWVDPGAINAIEYLLHGDVASVAAQYSYLPSPIALMTEDAYGRETAEAAFQSVYGYWKTLPRERRPKLYLFGLSLGALNSDRSFDFYDIIDDPFQGALWAGPPFRSDTWRQVTAERDAGSPAWLPQFGDGAVVRFGNHFGGYQQGKAPWGDFRIAYLQHGSDPIVFFDPSAAYRQPAWMQSPRAQDVSPDLQWYPIVTMLQLGMDMHAGIAPMGFGHSYAPADYVHAWYQLVAPPGWDEKKLGRLKEKLLKWNPR